MAGSVDIEKNELNLQVTVESGESLDVRQFSVTEGISTMFRVELVVMSGNAELDFDEVVGRPAGFAIRGSAYPRTWRGICSSMQQVGAEEHGVSTYQMSIVPTMWLLTQRRNYKMFQQKSELDIVKEVLAEWGIEPLEKLSGTYKKRKYRVQYAESDYAFVSRMLEDVGISFYFVEQASDGKKAAEAKLVLADAPHRAEQRTDSVPFKGDTSMVTGEYVTNVRLAQQVRPGRYSMRDHDYRRPPSYKLLASADASSGGVEQRLERYHYTPGAFLFGATKGDDSPVADDKGMARTDEREAEQLAQKRLDAKRSNAKVIAFETNAMDLKPGVVMKMHGHSRGKLNDDRLLIVAAAYNGTSLGRWSMHCEARSASMAYRPAVTTPKPRAHGVESATVVGPAGEEIHTDEFGRVRVHFHWDRESKMDDNSSCWIHVSQPWGGAGYGGTNLPRIGQEVLVDFLGGDPDRPVIIGRVYTNLQKTPYKLPENKTQTGMKSNSTGGGGGFNELMFEDAVGKELLRMQAEKDLKKLVKNDESVRIGNNRTKSVGANDSLTVGVNRTRRVGQNEAVSIGMNQKVSVGVNRSIHVGQIDAKTVGESCVIMVSPPGEGAGESTVFYMQRDKIEVSTPGGSKVTLEGARTKIEADEIFLCAKSKVCIGAPTINVVSENRLFLGAAAGNVDIKGGPLVRVYQLLNVATLQAHIDSRVEELKKAGLSPNDTDEYDASEAIGTMVGDPKNKAQIEASAAKYGVPPQLLAGVLASEMALDHEGSDAWQDGIARHLNVRPGIPDWVPIVGGKGVDAVGISSVHSSTMETAIKYLKANNLPGASDAAAFDKSAANMASFNGSTEAGAIVTSMYLHAKGGAPTPKDMAVLWGGYRAGVQGVSPKGGGYSLDGFRNNIANGTDNLPAQFQVGTNAYMSEPIFEYLDFIWSTQVKCC